MANGQYEWLLSSIPPSSRELGHGGYFGMSAWSFDATPMYCISKIES